MAGSLTHARVMQFGGAVFSEGADEVVTTRSEDLSRFAGDVCVVVTGGTYVTGLSAGSVHLEESTLPSSDGSAVWTDVTDGTITNLESNPDKFKGAIVLPLDKLKRYVRISATIAGGATEGGTDNIPVRFSISATALAIPKTQSSGDKYPLTPPAFPTLEATVNTPTELSLIATGLPHMDEFDYSAAYYSIRAQLASSGEIDSEAEWDSGLDPLTGDPAVWVENTLFREGGSFGKIYAARGIVGDVYVCVRWRDNVGQLGPISNNVLWEDEPS